MQGAAWPVIDILSSGYPWQRMRSVKDDSEEKVNGAAFSS